MTFRNGILLYVDLSNPFIVLKFTTGEEMMEITVQAHCLLGKRDQHLKGRIHGKTAVLYCFMVLGPSMREINKI